MTDRERLLALLEAFGVTPKTYGLDVLRLESGFGDVQGYLGFFVDFEFDADGKFREVGVYE